MKKYVFTIAIALACAFTDTATAQESKKPTTKPFSHLDLGVSLGSTGVGIDLAAPLNDYIGLRTGFDYMPRFEHNMHFDVQSFDDQGNVISSKLDKLTSTMYDLTGYRVDGTIDMVGKPTMWNFKLMVDFRPFRNKQWHLTAGFYWGPSKIAEAVNTIEDSPSLFAIGMYNHMYDNALKSYFGNPEPIIITGTDEDGNPDGILLDGLIQEKLLKYGRMGIHVGDYVDGHWLTQYVKDEDGNIVFDENDNPVTEYVLDANGNRIPAPYRMEPDENSMVSARVTTNSFKPYLGFGYGGRLVKGDDRYTVSFDAGLMFWGGTPDIITHDGTNLSKDVKNINGKVGRYVDIIKGVKAYPVLNLRITRRLF